MSWRVELLDRRVEVELDSLAEDVRQRFARVVKLIESYGLLAMREPHIKHLEGKLWEMRMKGKDGVGRAIYVTFREERVVADRYVMQLEQTNHRQLDGRWGNCWGAACDGRSNPSEVRAAVHREQLILRGLLALRCANEKCDQRRRHHAKMSSAGN